MPRDLDLDLDPDRLHRSDLDLDDALGQVDDDAAIEAAVKRAEHLGLRSIAIGSRPIVPVSERLT